MGRFGRDQTIGDLQDNRVQRMAAVAQLAWQRRGVAAAEQPIEEGYPLLDCSYKSPDWKVIRGLGLPNLQINVQIQIGVGIQEIIQIILLLS